MNRKFIVTGLAAGALALSGLAVVQPGASATTPQSGASGSHAVRVCAAKPKAGYATCYALARTDSQGHIIQSSKPLAAFTPTDVQKAYNLKGLKSHGRPVAIIDAYGYPNLGKDLTAPATSTTCRSARRRTAA